MLRKRRFRVLGDFNIFNREGHSIFVKADRPDADIWAYVPLTDPVGVLFEGRSEYQVPRAVFESHTEPWNARI
jgi:hypothetical protein